MFMILTIIHEKLKNKQRTNMSAKYLCTKWHKFCENSYIAQNTTYDLKNGMCLIQYQPVHIRQIL